MKIEVWTFGKENKSYVDEGVKLFTKRIKHYAPFEMKILSVGKKNGKLKPEDLKKKEAEVVFEKLTTNQTLVTLDEKGKSLSSVGLSKFIATRQLASDKTLVFLIGGAYGVDDKVLQKSLKVVSLSALVFPHQIVRLIMVEQIYRAFSILNHQPYHHL
ncbi:MAG TPA: 23S rRNA (pseudouridine(1915)-N(3))-methyltransferase RlmH [Chitinophagaceae bacterium]|nr:23S rRNA (pseudouridine(1915)-N(3))-methyltransferase RlmH [Chitinophagaceae bacterium]